MTELKWMYVCLLLAIAICAGLVMFVVEREADRVIVALNDHADTSELRLTEAEGRMKVLEDEKEWWEAK